MWLLPAFVAYLVVFTADALAKERCKAKVEECLRRGPTRPVCGTDNVTYPNRCHLLRAKCDASPLLAVKYKGRCGEKRSCWEEEMRVAVGSMGAGSGLYTPKCLADGSYAPLQCHNATGTCWCSTPNGKPINSTVLRHQIPVCPRRGKTRKDPGSRRRKHRKECGKIERHNFMRNLMIMLNKEYKRIINKIGSEISEEGLIAWQFNKLDTDNNETLSVNEYKGLRRTVKRVVKPKKCARSFVRMCDTNRDKLITKLEWTTCLNKRNQVIHTDIGLGRPSIPINEISEPQNKDDEPEANDCLSDRKSVLEEQKTSKLESYVPECTPDGRYQKVQCFKSIGYCWCAYEDTGKPIPGTSRKDDLPNCSVTDIPSRPMKGCPEHRKQVFIKDLMEFLMNRMPAENARDDLFTLLQTQSKDEIIAMRIFTALDINKNKVLERKEWKNFRKMISDDRKLRRCGNKLPRHCDVNNDQKISLTEWLNCLDAHRSSTGITKTSKAPRMPGLGPLEFLKEYD